MTSAKPELSFSTASLIREPSLSDYKRHDVAFTLIESCLNVMCLRGMLSGHINDTVRFHSSTSRLIHKTVVSRINNAFVFLNVFCSFSKAVIVLLNSYLWFKHIYSNFAIYMCTR